MRVLILFSLLFITSPALAADVIAQKTLKRGTIIMADDIKVLNGSEAANAGLPAQYIGRELTRTIYSGNKIAPEFVRSPQLVKRNMVVRMVYNYGPMQLSAKGRALQAGAKGEIISVMNLSSRKKIMAIVKDNNLVEVGR